MVRRTSVELSLETICYAMSRVSGVSFDCESDRHLVVFAVPMPRVLMRMGRGVEGT